MFNRFIEFFSSFQSGFTPLPVGKSEVEVFTNSMPTQVWLSKYDNGSLSVCHAQQSLFDYEITETGFVIYADVNTDGLILEWFVWLD